MGPPARSGGGRGPPPRSGCRRGLPLEVDVEVDPPKVDAEEDPPELDTEEDPHHQKWTWKRTPQKEDSLPPVVVVEEDQLRSTAGQAGGMP